MNAHAVHAVHEDNHAVVVGAVRVLVCKDDGQWFAQGIEIDYAAGGTSLEDAQRHFEKGLAATVDLHLRQHGDVERLLKFAPKSVWERLKTHDLFELSMVTVHDLAEGLGAQLPFERLVFLKEGGVGQSV